MVLNLLLINNPKYFYYYVRLFCLVKMDCLFDLLWNLFLSFYIHLEALLIRLKLFDQEYDRSFVEICYPRLLSIVLTLNGEAFLVMILVVLRFTLINLLNGLYLLNFLFVCDSFNGIQSEKLMKILLLLFINVSIDAFSSIFSTSKVC